MIIIHLPTIKINLIIIIKTNLQIQVLIKLILLKIYLVINKLKMIIIFQNQISQVNIIVAKKREIQV